MKVTLYIKIKDTIKEEEISIKRSQANHGIYIYQINLQILYSSTIADGLPYLLRTCIFYNMSSLIIIWVILISECFF